MKFKDIFVSKEEHFSIGIEEESNRYYISIPVSSGFADYEEYYELYKDEFDIIISNIDEMKKLAQRCKERKNDGRLIIKPGKNRGSTI